MSQSDGPVVVSDEIMDAARTAWHEALEMQTSDSWSYLVRWEGAMYAALTAAFRAQVFGGEFPLPERAMDELPPDAAAEIFHAQRKLLAELQRLRDEPRPSFPCLSLGGQA